MLSKDGVAAPEHEAASPSLLSVLFMWSIDQFQNKNESCGDGRHQDCGVLKYLPAWLLHWERRTCGWGPERDRKVLISLVYGLDRNKSESLTWSPLCLGLVPVCRCKRGGHARRGTLSQWVSGQPESGPEASGSLSSGQPRKAQMAREIVGR